LTIDRRYALVTTERGLIVSAKALTVLLIAREAGPAALAIYTVGLAFGAWTASFANFGSHFTLQAVVAKGEEEWTCLAHATIGSATTLGLIVAVPAGLAHASIQGGVAPSLLVAVATAMLVPGTAVAQVLGAIVKGMNDFQGHLLANAAEYLFLPLSIAIAAAVGRLTGVSALVLFALAVWISNAILWLRLGRRFAPHIVGVRRAIAVARQGKFGAGFQLGEGAAARADLIVLSVVATPSVVGVYALGKQVAEAFVHVPRVGGAILLNDVAAGRRRVSRGRAGLLGLQGILVLPVLIMPEAIIVLLGGPEYRAGATALRVLGIVSLVWGWAYLRAHESLGAGHGRRATLWSINLLVVLVPSVVVGYQFAGISGAAAGSLVAFLIAGVWLVRIGDTPGLTWSARR